ncbi:MAG: sugar transferase [Paludibacteraceae bacterium]|nr:sugar transferase [Paludibacteraceae bacterium]
MKRLFDILCSCIGLLVLSPLLLITAIWIKCDSDGPVLYRQTRVGRFGRDFAILKFRSMAVNSDKQGLITIGGHDSRVTRAGYYIRKYKVDELPQLVNVLKGDMSFVGPRPEVRKYVDLYTSEQLHVLDVRPGITDAASIKYRNENDLLAAQADPEAYYIGTIMPDKLAINLAYVQHHSLWGDLKLIINTFIAI